MTEREARIIIGHEKCEWLDQNGFMWSEQLPYSMQQGWTNHKCSFIFDDESGILQDIKDMQKHFNLYGQ